MSPPNDVARPSGIQADQTLLSSLPTPGSVAFGSHWGPFAAKTRPGGGRRRERRGSRQADLAHVPGKQRYADELLRAVDAVWHALDHVRALTPAIDPGEARLDGRVDVVLGLHALGQRALVVEA